MDKHFYESINEGKPTCIDDDIPFDIPESWEWCRLEDFCLYGEAPSIKVNECTPETWILDLEDIVAHAGRISKRITASERPSSSNKYSFDRGSVLYSKLRPYLNKVIVAEEPGCCTTEIIPIRLFAGVSPYYLQNLLMSPLFVEEINNEAYGVKMPRADTKLVKSFLIPVPPIQEQLRIVGFLEAQNEKLNTLQQSRKRYKRVLKETPTSLRQQLIQAAIQGLLVPQNPNDEPASKLLERIAEERTAKLGKKAAKSMSRIERRGSKTHATYHEIFPDGSEKDISEEIPFDIPDSWEWVRMGNIGFWAAGATPNRNISEYYGGTIPWLKTGDLTDSYIYTIPESITNLALEKTSVRLNPAGSVLMAMYGATIGKLGILTFSATTNQACCACVTYEGVYNLYLFYYLFSQRQNFINRGEGGAQPNISKEKITQSLFPLPPIHEQKRICERLRYLLRLIEQ